MDLPKLRKPIVSDLPIDLIVGPRAEERNGAGIHDEQNDSSRKDIYLQSVINSSFYFRSPIAVSSHPIRIHQPSLLLGVPEI